MTPIEIRKKIDINNNIIKEMMCPNIFSLNNAVFDLLKENKELQAQCQHEFDENGFCYFCDYCQFEEEVK